MKYNEPVEREKIGKISLRSSLEEIKAQQDATKGVKVLLILDLIDSNKAKKASVVELF